ncbi:MAG: hypothetical protein WD208_05885, partial [Dehalococcoidia bacterium]
MARNNLWTYIPLSALAVVGLLLGIWLYSSATASGDADSASDERLSHEAAMAIDYAATFDVSMDEATRRAGLLIELAPTLDAIRQEASGTLSGLYIEHEPELRVHLRLTASPGDALRSIIDDSPVPVVVSADAVLSLAETKERLDQARSGLVENVPGLMGIGTDERTGDVVLDVYIAKGSDESAVKSKVEEAASSLSRETGLSVRVEYLAAPQLPAGVTYGGTNLTGCTGGFVVEESGTGTLGLLTAGHCNASQTYNGFGSDGTYSLTFEDEELSSVADAQWHTDSETKEPEFYASSTSTRRPVSSVTAQSSMTVGNLVCHRGLTTGYSCGVIDDLSFQPTGACPINPSP